MGPQMCTDNPPHNFFCPYAIAVVFTNVRKLVLSGFSRRDRADLRLDGAWSLELLPFHSQST